MFSQTVEYALRAAVALARKEGESLTGKAISGSTQVPPRYLTKVLAHLIRGGLVHGSRGVGGGYTLAQDASRITLLDVVNAVEPMQRITHCPLALENHTNKLCRLHTQLDQAIAHVQHALSQCTLTQLAGSLDECPDHLTTTDSARPTQVELTRNRTTRTS